MFDDDRYYTPVDLAAEFIADHVTDAPRSCVDPTCGTGNFLRAASNHFGEVECFGLDRDRNAINALRRKEPEWILSVGDVLRPESYRRTSVLASDYRCDLLVLNPPFSHNGRKYFFVEFNSQITRASTAMAHVLRGLELFAPRHGGIAVVPESLLFSETDEQARSLLSAKYEYHSICELPACTFQGARARAAVLRLVPRENATDSGNLVERPKHVTDIVLVRGSLPVHAVRASKNGIPYIHSTDIARFKSRPSGHGFTRTISAVKGRIDGWLVLLPRVGVPKPELIAAIDVRQPVHLSDCVVALKASSQRKALLIKELILNSWAEFTHLYRGTGARYVTVKRLSKWLEERGVSVDIE